MPQMTQSFIAAKNGYAIITKDEDFLPRHRKDAPRVVVIWLRIGHRVAFCCNGLSRFFPTFSLLSRLGKH